MKFHINEYKGKFAMHCKTQEEAKDFCEYMHEHGRKWCSGSSYLGSTYYHYYENEMAYAFNEGCYSDVGYYKAEGYTILEWEDFMKKTFTKTDLKSGDIVLRRDRKICVVFAEVNALGHKDGFDALNHYADDLTNKVDQSLDIIAVRRPREPKECNLGYFNREDVTLIYDRERDETEEMTLEQVCKLLGKNIKIIK